jgi:hypothetical protein
MERWITLRATVLKCSVQIYFAYGVRALGGPRNVDTERWCVCSFGSVITITDTEC